MQVYRVFDEGEFPTVEHSVESSAGTTSRLAANPAATSGLESEEHLQRPRTRALAPTLIMLALAAVGVIVFNSIATFRRVRQRPTPGFPPSVTRPSPASAPLTPWTAQRPRRPTYSRRTMGTGRDAGRRPSPGQGAITPGVTYSPSAPSADQAAADAKTASAEFGFEREAAP